MRLLGAIALAFGVVGGPVLVWEAVHERDLNRSVARARPCAAGARHNGCLVRVRGVVRSVIWPNPGKSGYYVNSPGAGNVEPRLIVRLRDGRTIALDVGFANLPARGATVTAEYYGGYLLRARRSDGRLLATTWTPGQWKLHLLAGAAFIVAGAAVLLHQLRRSRGRS